MSEEVWPRRQVPAGGPEAALVGRWKPASAADVTAARRHLADAVGVSCPAVAVETLLLTFEELVSNAVRHGRAPVEVTVTADGAAWLVAVSDAAVERPPTPAGDRDAARGGLELYLVARTARRTAVPRRETARSSGRGYGGFRAAPLRGKQLFPDRGVCTPTRKP